ncbi:MAG: xanthine and CO dehydrogenase maturation [Prolixibacteraceae bacterium]|nr:MAG: xanthine and CO dehydrogenase maturation [Prolixibacteraceae bacterium]
MDTAPKTKHLYLQLLDLIRKNKSCVLATVTGSQGSTPQKPGSSAIFDKKKLVAGTVGGGAVELSIGKIAAEAIDSKKSGYFRFDLENDISDVDASICGGGMSILVDAAPEKHVKTFDALKESENKRVHGVLVTLCASGLAGCSAVTRFWITEENLKNSSGQIPEDAVTAATEMLSRRNPDDFREIVLPGSKEGEEKLVFLESVVPSPQLIIAGAGHVGKALSHYGKLLDFEVIVWDDRTEFANKFNLPDACKILSGSIDESLGNIIADRDTFIVIVTRGHKKDADVLKKFIGSKAGYTGMIGSRRKIVQVRELFLKSGWATIDQWEKIYTPIGLEIGSKTVQEIAVSIAAQLIQVRNQLKNQ